MHSQRFTAALAVIRKAFDRIPMAAVARRIGVSEASVSHWLHGRRTPKKQHLIRLYEEAVRRQPLPFQLQHLLQLHMEARCAPSSCRSTPLARQGDRHNSSAEQRRIEGDRRNGSAALADAALRTAATTSGTASTAGASTGIPGELRFGLEIWAISASLAEIMANARILLSFGHEDAARIILSTAARRHADMVDMVISALRFDNSGRS
ncbi:helix-turn-helix transcriptional regulator [Kitasatospora sp. NPDC088779]|uniref:helix-turn-helix domain-containing protein n=1 Tax=Kitasatospora sp. NPDC088779 TaxID=3154964 RepID=UPI00342C53CB